MGRRKRKNSPSLLKNKKHNRIRSTTSSTPTLPESASSRRSRCTTTTTSRSASVEREKKTERISYLKRGGGKNAKRPFLTLSSPHPTPLASSCSTYSFCCLLRPRYLYRKRIPDDFLNVSFQNAKKMFSLSSSPPLLETLRLRLFFHRLTRSPLLLHHRRGDVAFSLAVLSASSAALALALAASARDLACSASLVSALARSSSFFSLSSEAARALSASARLASAFSKDCRASSAAAAAEENEVEVSLVAFLSAATAARAAEAEEASVDALVEAPAAAVDAERDSRAALAQS